MAMADGNNSHSLFGAKMEKRPNPDNSSIVSLKRKRPPKIEIPNVLQEIQRDELKFKDLTSPLAQDDAVSFSVIGVAVSSLKGKKKFMEDTHKIISCLHGNSNKVIAFFFFFPPFFLSFCLLFVCFAETYFCCLCLEFLRSL